MEQDKRLQRILEVTGRTADEQAKVRARSAAINACRPAQKGVDKMNNLRHDIVPDLGREGSPEACAAVALIARTLIDQLTSLFDDMAEAAGPDLMGDLSL
jgi:hypothetical protein